MVAQVLGMAGRRSVLRGLVLPGLVLPGCAAKLPPLPSDAATTPAALAVLRESAAAHGAAALSGCRDVNVSYDGTWPALIARLQPALVDRGFRGGSQERLLLAEGLVAQAHTGPDGHKQVVRRTAPDGMGDAWVFLNGEETLDPERRAAAALVADGYALFLLGPMLLAGRWSTERRLAMALAGVERIALEGSGFACDVLRVRMLPGLGFSAGDELALFIDREERLLRRVRFSLNGLETTRGAVAEVDAFEHVGLAGMRWPTRFHERLLRPLPLPVHDWRLTGLDLDRGLEPGDVAGAAFSGSAVAPAAALPGRG